jgi:MoxR-like ATPase
MDLESKFRNLKTLEVERLLERHYSSLEKLNGQLYRLADGRKLVSYYATGSSWFSPTVEHLHNQLESGDLVVLAYTDEADERLWVFAVPMDKILSYIQSSGQELALQKGKKYNLNLVQDEKGFRLHPISLPVSEYQIASEGTQLTRPRVGLAEPPDTLLASTSLTPEQLKRLLRWRLDGLDERGEHFNFADIRRRLNAIKPMLHLLLDTPEDFSEASWQTVLDHMHSAQRQKGNIIQNNTIEAVRTELQAFLFDEETSLVDRFERCRLSNVGPSIKGELISWSDPDRYPINNSAAQAGLKFFGFHPGDDYITFQSAFAKFREVYQYTVGHLQADLPLNLEIDQLFNQIHKIDLQQQDKPGEDELPDDYQAKEAYWRVTLPAQGKDATVWPVCRDKGIAAIGFRDRGDNWQVRKFAEIKPGDWVVAFLREKRIGAIGRVSEPYGLDSDSEIRSDEDYWHGNFLRRIGVQWYVRDLSVDQLSPPTRNKFGRGTVVDLTPAEFKEIQEHYFDLLEEDTEEEPIPVVAYTVDDFVRCTYQADDQWYTEVTDLLREKGQIVLYGPPGTGKTFIARELAKAIIGMSKPGPERYRLVQFHPSYTYEEFIEGIRPESRNVDGHHLIEYPVRHGTFRRFCLDAKNQDGDCVFVIDEINRGNIASIFGELMYALEYRDEAAPVILPYSGDSFIIPPNVYIIGTMNTADRSISIMDFALRRRFHFIRCRADVQVLRRWVESKKPAVPYLLPLFQLLNEEIDEEDYQVGVSYFMDEALTEERLRRIWQRSIEPYLETYFIDDPNRVEPLRWGSDRLRHLRQAHGGRVDV